MLDGSFIGLLIGKFRHTRPPPGPREPGSDAFAFSCAYQHLDLLWRGGAVARSDVGDFLVSTMAHCEANGDRVGLSFVEDITDALTAGYASPLDILWTTRGWSFRDRHFLLRGDLQSVPPFHHEDRAVDLAMATLFLTLLFNVPWDSGRGEYRMVYETAQRHGRLVYRARRGQRPINVTGNDAYPDMSNGPRDLHEVDPTKFYGGLGDLRTPRSHWGCWTFSSAKDPMDYLFDTAILFNSGRAATDPLFDDRLWEEVSPRPLSPKDVAEEVAALVADKTPYQIGLYDDAGPGWEGDRWAVDRFLGHIEYWRGAIE